MQGYSTVPATSDAKEYLRLLLRHKAGLVAMMLLGVLLATLYLISAEPVYEAAALLEVKDGGVNDESSGGTDWNAPGVNEEANIILSRKVLAPVVDRYNLRNEISASKIPVLSDVTERIPAIGSWLSGVGFASKYAWNGETLELSKLIVPVQWEDEPLTFRSLGSQNYSVEKDGQMLVERAEIGEPLLIELNPLEPMELLVTNVDAPEGVEFNVVRKSTQETISGLHANLTTETNDSKTRMISVTHRNDDPVATSELLNAIVYKYRDVKLGSDSKETIQKMTFLEERLPEAKRELEAAEAALAKFRTSRRSVNSDLQNDLKLRQLDKLQTDMNELLFEKEELLKRYTNAHPSMRQLNKKIDAKQALINKVSGGLVAAPNTDRDLGVLEQREETARLIYTDLDERYRRAKIDAGVDVGRVTIWDEALVPKKPISPNPLLALVAATIGTLFCYIVFLTLRSALSTVINDQESLERSSGLPVYMNIPRSNAQKRIANASPIVDPRRMLPGGDSDGAVPTANVLAVQKPEDYSVENLRGLRSMLDDVMDDAPNNVLMICSPLPAMGKSFVSMNMAVLLAQAGKRVLLIDADYQRGQIHKSLGLSQGPGLPEVVKGKSELKETVRATSVQNLYAIPRGFVGEGATREAPTEKEFGAFLQVVAPRFDIAIIDTPPILSVSTAATIGRHAGASIMIVKEGEVKEQQLNESLKRLSFSGVRVNGCLMNNSSQPTPSHYAYYREQLD